MKKTILISLIIVLAMAIFSFAISTPKLISPIDNFYWILGGYVMGNQSFTINSTPIGTGKIMNATLYTNISGTWKANTTNSTIGAEGTEVNRIFTQANTNISTNDLSNGKVFVWNVYSCDNVSVFYNEPVILSGGSGGVSHYPVASVEGIMNDTAISVGLGVCNATLSSGTLKCNQTSINSSGTATQLLTPLILVNYTISSSCKFGTNRTVHAENAPSITLNLPTTGSYDTDGMVTINLTVTGDDSRYNCEIYSNDTGNWSIKSGGINPLNNTSTLTTNSFNEGNGIRWNAKCTENLNSNIYGWTSNSTISIDKTNPSISLISPADNAYQRYVIATNGYSGLISINVSDANVDSCALKINGTSNNTQAYTSGTQLNMSFNSSGSVYKWNVWCNDSTGRTAETSNRTLNLLTTAPNLNRFINYSTSGTCKGFTVEFNFSEPVNATFKYGTSSMSRTTNLSESDYSINQTFTLTFNNSYETNFYANLTFCNPSGNCNNTIPELIYKSPIPLCSGWSSWSVYDSGITPANLAGNSTAEYVYWYNNTAQSWGYYTSGVSSGIKSSLGIGDVAQLYTAVDNTYFRNNTGSSKFYINVTGGSVFLPLYFDWTFGNLSYSVFRADNGSNTTPTGYSGSGLEFRIDDFASYNNSNHKYNLFTYQWDTNNLTKLGKNYKNGLDTIWTYIGYNLSINFTANGEVIGNWTV